MVLLLCGVGGFLITHAKSALISGTASGLIIIALSFFVQKNNFLDWASIALTGLFASVFSWRFSLAFSAFQNGASDKLAAAIILGIMMVASIITLLMAIKQSLFNNK